MENQAPGLSTIFQALSDPTRRAILDRLGRGSASVGELALPFDMALPSFLKHIRLLEDSRLITTRKEGRVRTCDINPGAFAEVEYWLGEQKRLWEQRTDRLERFVTEE